MSRMRTDGAAGLQAALAETEKMEKRKRKEEKEKNQTVRLNAVISSIWLGASSWRANSGLAR